MDDNSPVMDPWEALAALANHADRLQARAVGLRTGRSWPRIRGTHHMETPADSVLAYYRRVARTRAAVEDDQPVIKFVGAVAPGTKQIAFCYGGKVALTYNVQSLVRHHPYTCVELTIPLGPGRIMASGRRWARPGYGGHRARS